MTGWSITTIFWEKKNGFLGYQSRNEDLTTVVGSQKFEISWIEELSRMFPFQFLLNQSNDFCGICQWLFFAGGLIELNPQRAERVADFWYTWVLASFAIQVLAECDKIDVFCPAGNFTPIFKTIFLALSYSFSSRAEIIACVILHKVI